MPRSSKEEESKKRAEAWVKEVYDQAVRDQTKHARKKLAWLARKKKKRKLTIDDIDRAMVDVLCYGSLAMCCAAPSNPRSGKPCAYRDSLLKIIEMTEKQYCDYKQGCEELLWLFLKQKKIV